MCSFSIIYVFLKQKGLELYLFIKNGRILKTLKMLKLLIFDQGVSAIPILKSTCCQLSFFLIVSQLFVH